ncbi:MAG: M23 family metallopeptidase, partial [Firmicutes bacterium]|nr:M23 family metallopeptidase [Bacillota bacterium]
AENEQDRRKAKKRIVHVVVSLILCGLLFGMLTITGLVAPRGVGGRQITISTRNIGLNRLSPIRFNGMAVNMEVGRVVSADDSIIVAQQSPYQEGWMLYGESEGEIEVTAYIYLRGERIRTVSQIIRVMEVGQIGGGNGGGGGGYGSSQIVGDMGFAWPLAVRSDGSYNHFGLRSAINQHHFGIDLPRGMRNMVPNTTMHAVYHGVVVQTTDRVVRIRHTRPGGFQIGTRNFPHLYSYYLTYRPQDWGGTLHNRIDVSQGQTVTRGQVIGIIGNLLHFEIRTWDFNDWSLVNSNIQPGVRAPSFNTPRALSMGSREVTAFEHWSGRLNPLWVLGGTVASPVVDLMPL